MKRMAVTENEDKCDKNPMSEQLFGITYQT